MRVPKKGMSYFAVFLWGSAPLRENCRTKKVISRKDAKTRKAKPRRYPTKLKRGDPCVPMLECASNSQFYRVDGLHASHSQRRFDCRHGPTGEHPGRAHRLARSAGVWANARRAFGTGIHKHARSTPGRLLQPTR